MFMDMNDLNISDTFNRKLELTCRSCFLKNGDFCFGPIIKYLNENEKNLLKHLDVFFFIKCALREFLYMIILYNIFITFMI